ncbi:MAG: cell division protein ZapA [Alphaproteobacteria bacterium]|nr:cell division protein ZapA [Alphaproteobacteria bacterium]
MSANKPAPAKIAITLYNRDYVVNCAAGQETRLRQIAEMVQKEMEAVAGNVGNQTEPRHLMLTCLSLADKLLEARNTASDALTKQEDLFIAAVHHLKQRVDNLASPAGRA